MGNIRTCFYQCHTLKYFNLDHLFGNPFTSMWPILILQMRITKFVYKMFNLYFYALPSHVLVCTELYWIAGLDFLTI